MEDGNKDTKKIEELFENFKKEIKDELKTKTPEENSPEPKKESVSKTPKPKIPAKTLILIAVAIVAVAVAASVIVAYNATQPTIQETEQSAPAAQEIVQSETKAQEIKEHSTSVAKQPESSKPVMVLAKLSDEKREFVPTLPKKGESYYSKYTEEELAAKEARLQEIHGDQYIPIKEQIIEKYTSPLYLDVTENPIGKAAIIDMLWDKEPNRSFLQRSNDLLAKTGYSVDIYLTDDATVNLYKKLPTMNYDYIIWRTHGLEEWVLEKSAVIYTGEVWRSGAYYNEQVAGQLHFGYPYTPPEVEEIGWQNLADETYYTIGSVFVKDAMEGKFNDTVIIIGGCDALSGNTLAKSFINKGASLVVGWSDIIGSHENDEGILLMLEDMLLNQNPPEYAAKTAMDQLEIHPSFKNSKLKFVSANI